MNSRSHTFLHDSCGSMFFMEHRIPMSAARIVKKVYEDTRQYHPTATFLSELLSTPTSWQDNVRKSRQNFSKEKILEKMHELVKFGDLLCQAKHSFFTMRTQKLMPVSARVRYGGLPWIKNQTKWYDYEVDFRSTSRTLRAPRSSQKRKIQVAGLADRWRVREHGICFSIFLSPPVPWVKRGSFLRSIERARCVFRGCRTSAYEGTWRWMTSRTAPEILRDGQVTRAACMDIRLIPSIYSRPRFLLRCARSPTTTRTKLSDSPRCPAPRFVRLGIARIVSLSWQERGKETTYDEARDVAI